LRTSPTKVHTPPSPGCAMVNRPTSAPGTNGSASRRTSFATSTSADGRQQRYLVTVSGRQRSLVRQHGAVERQLDLVASHCLTKLARQRIEQPSPVERLGEVLLGRGGEIGELAEEHELDGHRISLP